MQIERHELPDGGESLIKRVFEAQDRDGLRAQLTTAHRRAVKQDTVREVKQVEFDPEDPCPCGSPKKAKNCCAGRLLRRLRAERYEAEKATASSR